MDPLNIQCCTLFFLDFELAWHEVFISARTLKICLFEASQKLKCCLLNRLDQIAFRCFPFVLRNNAASLPITTHVCGKFWEKPLVLWLNVCLATCALHPMCFHPRWENADTRTCTHKGALKHTNVHTLADQCTLFLCQSHTHNIFPGGQAGGLAGTEMDTCWDQSSSVWFTFLSLSLFLSVSSFLLPLIVDTPLPPLPALFTPLCLWKAECFKCILHTNSSENCSWTYRGN